MHWLHPSAQREQKKLDNSLIELEGDEYISKVPSGHDIKHSLF